MTQIEFIQRLEDYKQRTDMFPHTVQRVQLSRKQVQIVKKSAKKSKTPDNQKTKD